MEEAPTLSQFELQLLQTARKEVETLKGGRRVYERKGKVHFLSKKEDALRNLNERIAEATNPRKV